MYNKEQRNRIGLIAWSALALLLGVLVIIPMIAREVYQSKTTRQPIEWDDIAVYGLFILVFSLFHWCIIDMVSLPWWLAF